MHNLSRLREEALQRLKTEGHVPFEGFEGHFVGYVLVRVVPGEDRDERKDTPPLQAAGYEIDVLDMGKWEWLVAWLSPWHQLGCQYPDAIGEIAMVLLGHQPMPDEATQRIALVTQAQR